MKVFDDPLLQGMNLKKEVERYYPIYMKLCGEEKNG